MRADIRFLDAGRTDTEKYDLINMLPVRFEQFAVQSNLFGRAYGVITGEETGYSGPEGEKLRSFVLNRCVRSALYQKLLEQSRETERIIGYKLGERYLRLDEPYRGPKIALPSPGATALEVQRSWYETELTAEIEFFLEEGVTLFDDDSVIIAKVDREIFENPKWAVLRKRADNKVLIIDETHARYAEIDGNDWLLPITRNALVDTEVDAQHRRFVRCTLAKPLPDVEDLPEDALFVPVYPGTNQIIPHEVIDETEDEIIYQFDVWVLVAPGFQNETVSWERFERYKFYQEIAFAYYAETACYARLIWGSGTEQVIYQYDPEDPDAATMPRLEVTLQDSARSIVHLNANCSLLSDLSPFWNWACGCRNRQMPQTVTLEICYKVEPEALPERLQSQIQDIQQGLIAKVAAELPTSDCGCPPPDVGFVTEMQFEYTHAYINHFTETHVVKREYGQLHGQWIYKAKLANKQIYRRPLRLAY